MLANPVSPPSDYRLSASEWLASPYLGRAAGRIAYEYGLLPEDFSDLLQDLRLALLKAAPNTRFNATWVFTTARHKAVDILRHGRPPRFRGQARADPGNRAELLHLLHARVDSLGERLRGLYALRFEQGMSQQETAETLGLRRGQVRSLERMCLSRILGRIQRNGRGRELRPGPRASG